MIGFIVVRENIFFTEIFNESVVLYISNVRKLAVRTENLLIYITILVEFVEE